jgi:arylsulfatase A-like enzyme
MWLPVLAFSVLLPIGPLPVGTVPIGQEAAREPVARPSVVLVTADTLRRDHLGCYGYPRPTSPRVDALAAESVVFERAFAPMATTFPSHLSMLTGLYPHQHGLTSNRDGALQRFAPSPGRVSLAVALAQAGWRTAAFTSSVVLHERTGIAAGFQTYDGPANRSRSGKETMERALAWLRELPAGEPYFLWVHLWDPHEPNAPAPTVAELFAPDEALRAWVSSRGLDLPGLNARFGANAGVCERFFGRVDSPAERRRRQRGRASEPAATRTIDEPMLLDLYARYDACVRQVDTEVGRLLDALAARGTLSDTAFVFTADHGQSLGEGRFFGHGLNTQVNTAVPLLIRFPTAASVAPQRSRALVSLVDLVPMLLARMPSTGLEDYRAQLVGADALAPGFARERIFTSEATEFHGGSRQDYACAVLSGRWKYVRGQGGTGRLYDLEGAGDAVDVATQNPALVQELEGLLTAELTSSILGRATAEAPDPESAEILRQLEDLGYGGGDEEDD